MGCLDADPVTLSDVNSPSPSHTLQKRLKSMHRLSLNNNKACRMLFCALLLMEINLKHRMYIKMRQTCHTSGGNHSLTQEKSCSFTCTHDNLLLLLPLGHISCPSSPGEGARGSSRKTQRDTKVRKLCHLEFFLGPSKHPFPFLFAVSLRSGKAELMRN